MREANPNGEENDMLYLDMNGKPGLVLSPALSLLYLVCY